MLAQTARLIFIAAGGWWLSTHDATAQNFFWLAASSMVVLGVLSCSSVVLTRWGPRERKPTVRPVCRACGLAAPVAAMTSGEIYPVRSGLEEVAARTAAVRLGGRLEAFEREIDAMRRAADAGDAHAFMPHDVQFHRLMVEGSGNRTLQDLWTSLHVEARR